MKKYFLLAMIFVLLFSTFAFAQTTSPTQAASIDWDAITNILLMFLVLSVFFEQALSPVFGWSVFLKHCDGKGWKTPITLALAFLLFYGFKLNIFHEVIKAFGIKAEPTGFSAFMGYVITSFLIAGGSQGIFNIMTKLKIRNPLETKTKAEKLQAKKAEEQKAKENTKQD